MNAKCHAIRDAQLIEKVDIKKEQLEEEKRLDEMMEVERRKALKEYEEREKAAHFERLKGAQVLQHQITDREQIRLLDEEKKDQETKVIINILPSVFQAPRRQFEVDFYLRIYENKQNMSENSACFKCFKEM